MLQCSTLENEFADVVAFPWELLEKMNFFLHDVINLKKKALGGTTHPSQLSPHTGLMGTFCPYVYQLVAYMTKYLLRFWRSLWMSFSIRTQFPRSVAPVVDTYVPKCFIQSSYAAGTHKHEGRKSGEGAWFKWYYLCSSFYMWDFSSLLVQGNTHVLTKALSGNWTPSGEVSLQNALSLAMNGLK